MHTHTYTHMYRHLHAYTNTHTRTHIQHTRNIQEYTAFLELKANEGEHTHMHTQIHRKALMTPNATHPS